MGQQNEQNIAQGYTYAGGATEHQCSCGGNCGCKTNDSHECGCGGECNCK
jgi:hypothetical protein